MSRKIFITELDMKKLKKMITRKIEYSKDESFIRDLVTELERAQVVENDEIPNDVITMNSKILLLMDGNEEEITLVYPNEAEVTESKISVLSPIGTAVLGYREGDSFEWRVPSGIIKVMVKKVLYQPEASERISLSES